MARGINKVILVGHVGQDPETKTFNDGGSVTNVSLATSESWKDKNTGERKEATEWHRLVFRNKLAEIVGEYVRKGSSIYVEGKLRTRKWQDQSGNDRYTTEVTCFEMQMLDKKPSDRQGGASQPGYGDVKDGTVRPPQTDSFNDDIPF